MLRKGTSINMHIYFIKFYHSVWSSQGGGGDPPPCGFEAYQKPWVSEADTDHVKGMNSQGQII